MSKPFDFGEINLGVEPGERASVIPDADIPFRILLLGDFTGRASRGVRDTGARLATQTPLTIDRDNFDEILAKSKVVLNLPVGAEDRPLALRFSELDDFHPDRIFERFEMFQRLREVRSKLQDPTTFAAAAAELGLLSESDERTGKRHSEPRSTAPPDTGVKSGSLLDEMIDQTEAKAAVRTAEPRSAGPADDLQEFVRRVTATDLVAATDPRQAEIMHTIDQAASAQMRALLHVVAFQELESAWRALYFLVRRIETNSQLAIHVVDVSKAELAADLLAAEDLRSSGIYELLVEKTLGTPGGKPWAVIAGNYTFGPERSDVELLGHLAKLANAAGAPFIAAGSPRLLGCSSFADSSNHRDWGVTRHEQRVPVWEALRNLEEASSVGLALPRFLLRMPYGAKTDPIESFVFEEMTPTPVHDDYLWTNPAFACALLLAQAFSERGWEMRAGSIAEIEGLPLHVYEKDGESVLKPCAEGLLTQEAAEIVLENGLMPFVSLKDRDAIRLIRFQSIADPPAPLIGPWTGR